MSKSTAPVCALLTIAAAAALTSAGPAAATYNDTSAGGACHAANGGAENKFTYNNNYLTNIGTADQYVICHFAMNDTSSAVPLTNLKVHTGAGATPGTVTCVGQYGSFYAGSNHIESTQAKNVSVGAGSYGEMDFTATFTRSPVYNTFTLNCKVPGGFKLGLIEYWEG